MLILLPVCWFYGWLSCLMELRSRLYVERQETNFMKIIPNKIQPISISYVPRTMFYNIILFTNCHCNELVILTSDF